MSNAIKLHVDYEEIKNLTVNNAVKKLEEVAKFPKEIDLETLGKTAAGYTGVYLFFAPKETGKDKYFYIGVAKHLIKRAINDQLYGYVWKHTTDMYNDLKIAFVVFGRYEQKKHRIQAGKLEKLFIATLQPTVNNKKGNYEIHKQYLDEKKIIEYVGH